MSYVDAIFNSRKNEVQVIERVEGKRIVVDHPCEWSFYYDDPNGKHRTIYRTPVTKFSSNSKKDYQKELRMRNNRRIWESDINPVNKVLEKYYLNNHSPKLNICFFDIEVDFSPTLGFAPTNDPFNKITAISLYCTWIDSLITLVIPPRGMSYDEAAKEVEGFDNVLIFGDEGDMIETFFELIEDADVLSGWNSEGYDIPYMVNRTERILSKNDTRRFCLFNHLPKPRKYEKFGKEQYTYDLIGRIHLDSLNLYQKYTYHEMHSYSLDAIAEYELNERKIQYSGTLDQLYNNDFRKFVDYNRQDTLLLHRLEEKLQFVDLANEIAHDNSVTIPGAMGAVGVTEQALINFAHKQGLVVPNRVEMDVDAETRAAGAYVATPKKGIHKYVGAIDIKSLYPSDIRALNMSPETIIGQLLPTHTGPLIAKRMAANGGKHAQAWEGMFGTLEYQYMHDKDETKPITIEWSDKKRATYPANEVYDYIFHGGEKWVVSANGTIFDHSFKGIIPGILEQWYEERIELQVKKREATDKEEIAFWDKRQLVKKINLNSLYGAVLHPYCRFYVFDIGQSTTLTGRCIAKHMSAFVNESLTGEYDHTGEAIIAGDTDSVYFSIWPTIRDAVESGNTEWSKELCTTLYDNISDAVNESFPTFMKEAFNCPHELGSIIEGGRELVATTGLFIKKKRYGLMIYDDEGTRRDVDGKSGKVKAMGMDLKRSDTPGYMQEFLMEVLVDTLNEVPQDDIIEKIRDFKTKFNNMPSWEKGTPKRVNNLTKYTKKYKDKTPGMIPGHVTAAIHWNILKEMYGDHYSMNIQDGQKTIVCQLKKNPLGMERVSYPIDENHIPDWFKELPFDDNAMMEAIVDKKLDNLLGVLKWRLKEKTDVSSSFDSLFDFV